MSTCSMSSRVHPSCHFESDLRAGMTDLPLSTTSLKKTHHVIVWLPLATAMLSSFTCAMSYVIAIREGRMRRLPFIPFISDTGDHRPQSSLFTLGLALSCFVTLIIGIIRFFQIKNVYHSCRRVNRISLVVCIIFVFGKLVVSAFQLSSVIWVHFLGAGLYFLGAAIYSLLQVHISTKVPCRRYVLIVRLVCTCGMFVSGMIFGIFMSPQLTHYNRNGLNVAQSAEWCFAILKSVFMVTFVSDFWKLYPILDLKFAHIRTLDMFVVSQNTV